LAGQARIPFALSREIVQMPGRPGQFRRSNQFQKGMMMHRMKKLAALSVFAAISFSLPAMAEDARTP